MWRPWSGRPAPTGSQQVLLLDGGDNLQGQPLVYYANFVDVHAPHAVATAFNALDYDVVAVGNHDVEAGHDVYDRVAKELKAGFVSANLVREADGKPCFAPYKVVRKGGARIAVLGLTEPAFVKNFPKTLYAGIRVEDLVACARKWVPIIQEKEHPDVLLGLFHAGLDTTAGVRGVENSSQLVAQSVPGFDAVFVGHDHAGWDGRGYDPVTKERVDVVGPDGRVVPIYGAHGRGPEDPRRDPDAPLRPRFQQGEEDLPGRAGGTWPRSFPIRDWCRRSSPRRTGPGPGSTGPSAGWPPRSVPGRPCSGTPPSWT